MDPLAAGAQIGDLRLLEKIGGGGAGVVYAAEDGRGRRVAVKVLRAGADDGERAKERFLREARAANAVRHPAIVPVLEVGRLADGRPYLVLPLLEGRSLQEAIAKDGPLTAEGAWRALRPVVEALGRAHRLGIVHRDVKPSNIFLERGEGRREAARLLDFGLAHRLDAGDAAEAAKLTQTGQLIGTPAYMAPEQWWGLPPASEVDQYALGATLFEVMTGRTVFEAASIAALVQKHLHAPPPSLREAGAAVPDEVDALVRRLLAKEPQGRFASMEAVLEAGDAAFPGGAALTATVPIAIEAAAPERAGPSPLRAYLPWHAAAIVLGLGAIVAVGYAGEARHDPIEWLHIGGYMQSSAALAFVAAAIALPLLARRRAGAAPAGAFALALAPAILGALGTYPNLQAVERTISRVSGIDAFRAFCHGAYEAGAARFVGFTFSAILCASLASWPRAPSASDPPPVELRGRAAALFTLSALALSAALVGAPSGALAQGFAAACLLATLVPAAARRALSAPQELTRAAASLLAIGLGFAVGVARVEARQAVLWAEQPDRAERVAEITDARAEMTAALLLGAAALLCAAIPLAQAVARAARAAPISRPSRAAIATSLAALAALALDVAMHERLLSRREELRAELTAQFATFVGLDPPPADGLDPEAFHPRRATALQITRAAIAINGHAVAKLSALDTAPGALNVTAALHQSLAQATVDQDESDVDLAVFADEAVPYGRVERLLCMARAGGARRVDLLFRRGPKPRVSPDSPPETAYVIPSDFVALPAELADDGFSASADSPWSQVASRLIAAPGSGPVRLRAPP